MNKKEDEYEQKLKKAKRAVRLAHWLNFTLPTQYHCMAVNLECCSIYFLEYFLSRFEVCRDAELLLVDKYLFTQPELILAYLTKHSGHDEMLVKIIEQAPATFILKVLLNPDRFLPLKFAAKAQSALVKKQDVLLFKQIISGRAEIHTDAVTTILYLQNEAMLRFLFNYKHFRTTFSLNLSQQNMLIEFGDKKMLECYCEFADFHHSLLCKLIDDGNISVLDIIFKKKPLHTSVQKHLAKKGSQQVIAHYLQYYPLCSEAQIELMKNEYKDLLKEHFIRYGMSEQALLYLLSLNHFKAYLGI